jgi:hypothetical protein
MTCHWILALWLPSIASAQMQCNGVYWLDNFTVGFRTISDRDGPPKQSCGETTTKGDTIRRVLFDTNSKPYFGYEIRITNAGAKRYRAEMRPLTGLSLLSFSRFPQPVVVGADEYIDVPVLERLGTSDRPIGYLKSLLMMLGLATANSPGTSGRLTDYLQIVPKGTPWAGFPFRSWAGTPPSGTLLTLDRPRLSDLLSDLGRNQEMGVIGPVVWLYREGRGRFLFSASARPGFRKTALAEGSVLRFSIERDRNAVDEYTVGLHSNAVPMPGAWMMWVKYEPGFRRVPGPWTKEELNNGMLAIGVER